MPSIERRIAAHEEVVEKVEVGYGLAVVRVICVVLFFAHVRLGPKVIFL